MRTTPKYIVSSAVALILLIGLGLYLQTNNTTDSQPSKQATVVSDPESVAPPVEQDAWAWQYSNLEDGTKIQAPEGKFILTFSDNKKVMSTTDCNTLSGSYIRDGEIISFSPFTSTKMYCKQSLESTYSDELSLATSYYIVGDEMRLNLNRDAGIMIFKKK
jgi:heat shock protein HslJ